jgi:hypothetical protein
MYLCSVCLDIEQAIVKLTFSSVTYLAEGVLRQARKQCWGTESQFGKAGGEPFVRLLVGEADNLACKFLVGSDCLRAYLSNRILVYEVKCFVGYAKGVLVEFGTISDDYGYRPFWVGPRIVMINPIRVRVDLSDLGS